MLSIATLVLLFKMACDDDSDIEAICRARLAKVVKRDILEKQETLLAHLIKQNMYPQSLLALVKMIYKWS